MVANIVITLLGGLALFLFGMKTMSDGLQKVAGPTMRSILSTMTGNRFSGVLHWSADYFYGAVLSSATTVMLISFVSAALRAIKDQTALFEIEKKQRPTDRDQPRDNQATAFL